VSKKWREGDRREDRYAKTEKMRKRDKRTPRSADLKEEFEKPESEWPTTAGYFGARVVEVHKRYCFVSAEKVAGEVDTKDVWLATMARKFLVAERAERNFVAVGDRVLCQVADQRDDTQKADLPQCVIQNLMPRTSKISRIYQIDPRRAGMEQVLAANIDQLVIVASYLNPKVRWGLIDRYLVLAEGQGIPSVIVLNKKDLLQEAEPEFLQACKERVQILRSLGYEVIEVSALDPKAKSTPEMKKLGELLKGRISLLSGHSGVGKSSIINLFKPELVQAVEPDADIFYKGRHTTSFASFIRLGTGGYAIDTPGIRSFMIHEHEPIELTHCFVEMRPMLGHCKFRECRHVDEPGCVILEALAQGRIHQQRYRSYLALLLGETGRTGRVRDIDPEEFEV